MKTCMYRPVILAVVGALMLGACNWEEGSPENSPATDAGADGIEDADASDGNSERSPDPAWAEFEKRCAPDDRVVEPERVEREDPVAYDGEVPQLLWERAEVCPEQRDPYDYRTRHDFGYGEFEIDGEERKVVVVVKDDHTTDVLGPSPAAVAVLDAETGESIECFDLPHTANNIESSLKIVSGEAVYLPYTTQGGEAAEIYDIPDIFGLIAYRPDEGELFRNEIEFSGEPRTGKVESTITRNGQVIVNWKQRRLVSFDHETGEVYWTVGMEAFGAGEEESGLRGPMIDEPGRTLVEFEGRNFEVDRCGEVTSLGEGPDLYRWLPLEDGKVTWSDEEVVVEFDDRDAVEFDVGCDLLVTLGEGRFGCIERVEYSSTQFKYMGRVLDSNTTDIHEKELEEPQESRNSVFQVDIVAGRSGYLLFPVEYFTEDSSKLMRRLVVKSVPDLDDEYTIDFAIDNEPGNRRSSNMSTAPVLTPDGKLIVALWGRVYAVQTDIPGLALGSHPRGKGLGGNENRGFVEVESR